MNNKSNMIKLKTTIETYKTSSPILIVGGAFKLFLKAWKYKTISIIDESHLEEVIEYYQFVEPTTPLVIYDLSILSKKALNRLLKFIEEYKHPLILGSTLDNFDNILLSRIKTYVRFNTDEIKSELMTLGAGLRAMEELTVKDTSSIDRIKQLQKYSPQLYYYEQTIKARRGKDKIISILGGGE